MNFPKFWALGKSGDFSCWHWSFQSLAEAQSLANEAAKQLAQRFRDGVYPKQGGHYYPDRPAREQVLQEMTDSVVREIAWEVVPDCVERVVAVTVERLARESLAKRG